MKNEEKKKIYKIFSLIIICLIALIFFVYLVFIRNRIYLYSINYVDDNIKIEKGFLFISNELNILNFIQVKDQNDKEISTIKLFYIDNNNEERLVISCSNNDLFIEERYDSDEYNLDKLPNHKFYITINYKDETTKTIELHLKKEFSDVN